MRILVDLDGVVVNWTKRFEHDLERYFPDLEFPLLREFSTPTNLPKEHRDAIDYVKNREGFYRHMEPIEGAFDAILSMSEYHDVWFCSTPEVENVTCASDKISWVYDFLGSDFAKRVILTHDKTLVRGDILIDDRPDITGVQIPTWRQIIFTQLYNTHVRGLNRLDRWSDWRVALERETETWV